MTATQEHSLLPYEPGDPQRLYRELSELVVRQDEHWQRHIGYPGAADVDLSALTPLWSYLLNNIGDPWEDGSVVTQSKAMERQVLRIVADLLRAPANGWWGVVTTGASEGTLQALRHARAVMPGAVVYFSQAAHYSVAKAVDLLAMPSVMVRATDTGEMDYDDLAYQMWRQRQDQDRPAVVVATIGTTMTEAIDDVTRIHQACDRAGVERRFVHADAALAGIPLALVPPEDRPGFDFAADVDAVIVSGHKFLSARQPCGVLILRTRTVLGNAVDYIGGHDSTISGSRSGHMPVVLWYVLHSLGLSGLRSRARASRITAAYAEQRLQAIGWRAWRTHRHAFTVVMNAPPRELARRWSMPISGQISHIVCMPGITPAVIDLFVQDLAAATGMDRGAGHELHGAAGHELEHG